jgi:dUTPase
MTQIHNIGIKLLHPNAQVPKKANPTDSCYDVVSVRREELTYEDKSLYYHERESRIYGYKYYLGFALDLPPNTELQVRARSSIYKTGLTLCNGIGTGDEGYTGEYCLVFYHVVPELPPYVVGDRVAQIMCINRADINFNLVDELPDKDRGNNGFGSSGVSSLLERLYPESKSNITEISKELGEHGISSVSGVYSFPCKEEYEIWDRKIGE